MGLWNGLTTWIPANNFLERLNRPLNWKPIELALQTDVSGGAGKPVILSSKPNPHNGY
jgi:hypothetical protein